MRQRKITEIVAALEATFLACAEECRIVSAMAEKLASNKTQAGDAAAARYRDMAAGLMRRRDELGAELAAAREIAAEDKAREAKAAKVAAELAAEHAAQGAEEKST